jgi:hypothetical protein
MRRNNMDRKNPVKDALEMHREMYERRKKATLLFRTGGESSESISPTPKKGNKDRQKQPA